MVGGPELYAALATAQAAIVGAAKDAQNPFLAKKGPNNTLIEGTGMYVTLSSYIEAARPVFAANGLSVITMPHDGPAPDGFASFSSTLAHSSGQFITRNFFIPLVKKDAQGFGGTMTYARKYCLAGWGNMWAEDDDGETAVGRGGGKTAAKPAAPSRPVKELIEALSNAPSMAALDALRPDCGPYRNTEHWPSIEAVAVATKARLEQEAKDAAKKR